MTSTAVKTMRNDTAPPTKGGTSRLVREELKSSARSRTAYLFFLLTLAPAADADALPMRNLSLDPASATGETTPYIDRGVRDTRASSDTQPLSPVFSTRVAYQRRITQLCSFAEEDGIELNVPSKNDFFYFACTEPRSKAASLVLLDNGNLRAVWRSGQQEVGVQFYGGGLVQYLISGEGDNGNVTYTVRRGPFRELSAAIESAGLSGLLYE